MEGIGKGTPGPGRPKGSQNKTTRGAKEAFTLAFEELGGFEAMVKWAKSDPDNLKVFYGLYARLIPQDMTIHQPDHIEVTMEVIDNERTSVA